MDIRGRWRPQISESISPGGRAKLNGSAGMAFVKMYHFARKYGRFCLKVETGFAYSSFGSAESGVGEVASSIPIRLPVKRGTPEKACTPTVCGPSYRPQLPWPSWLSFPTSSVGHKCVRIDRRNRRDRTTSRGIGKSKPKLPKTPALTRKQ